jgi:hypothetical protein
LKQTHTTLSSIGKKFQSKKALLSCKKALVGFDGFVDHIIDPVDTRVSVSEYTPIQTIRELGERIIQASGKSTNIELVPILDKLGGNGPIMASAMSNLGCDTTHIGYTGSPTHTAFKELEKGTQLISLGEPGHTDALEFADGKLMLGKIASVANLTWDTICEKVGEDRFKELLLSSNLVGCTSWTMLPGIKDILDKMISFYPDKSNTIVFFDLADPQKRLQSEVEELLRQIQDLNRKTPCILGLNLKEAEQVASILGYSFHTPEDSVKLANIAQRLQDILQIHGIVLHTSKWSAAASSQGSVGVTGPHTNTPKITTGAGDHFNGGFCCGLLAELSFEESLYIGMATAGWYVRHDGNSPYVHNIVSMLEKMENANPQ